MIQPPLAAYDNRSLANDVMVPPVNPLGVAHQGITAGSGPKSEQIFYINYDGVTITKTSGMGGAADDDATQNRSWIPNVGGGGTISIPAFDPTPFQSPLTAQQVKDNITQMVKDWYVTYNVLVVTARPALGDGVCPTVASGQPCDYTMIVVGGMTSQVVTGASVTDAVGVAGIDCGNQNQNNIGFAFSASELPASSSSADKQQAMLLVAQTVAHEAGHTFGLEHVVSTSPNFDIMGVSVNPGVQGFENFAQPLVGSELPTQCGASGDTTENTSARLTLNPGPAPSGPVVAKPTVTWLAPKQGQTLPRDFTAALSVVAGGGTVTKVDIVQAGVIDAEMTSPPYQAKFSAPAALPDGSQIRFTAIAYNSLGGKASVPVDFTISSSATQGAIGCLLDADCMSGEKCTGGSCVAGPLPCVPGCLPSQTCMPDGTCSGGGADMAGTTTTNTTVGMTCTDSSQCGTDGVCATASGKMYCTVACDPAVATSCPADYQCAAVGADHFCGPKSHGCEMSRSASSSPLALAWVIFALAAFALRRRLRPSAT